MSGIIMIKEKLRKIYAKNDMFLNPLGKFLMAFLTLLVVNSNIGFMSKLNNIVVVFLISSVCAVLPSGMMLTIISLVIVAHLYSLSLELAVVTIIVLLVMFMFYFRFTGSKSGWVVFSLLCCILKIPYIVPIAAGLLSGIFTFIPVSFGVILYYIITFGKDYSKVVAAATEKGDLFDNFLAVITGLLNKDIIVLVVSFSLTVLMVYLIRRLSIDYSWIYATVAGALTDFVVVLIGNAAFKGNIEFGGNLIGLVLAIVVGLVLSLVFFGVDYSRTERVQYEDDNYYYYVKVVPKYSMSSTDVKIKTINTQKKRRPADYDD